MVQPLLVSYTHSGAKSLSVSNVMFHLMHFTLGRILTLLGKKR